MILDDIIKRTKEDLKEREAKFSMDWLGRSLAFNARAPRDVRPFLTSTPEEPYRIISEVKKASPSKGVIREDFDPVAIAQALEKQPDSPFYIDSLAWGHYKNGECAEALRLIQQVESIMGSDEQEVRDHLKAIEKCKTK